jgi:hypothetical protein
MFVKEIINPKWLELNSTLAIIFQFNVYNPNLQLVSEKRIVLEFFETGGFINLEHDQVITNMKLSRTAE